MVESACERFTRRTGQKYERRTGVTRGKTTARIHQPGGVYFPRPITIGKPITLTNSRCSKCSCGINRHWTRIIGGWMAEVNEYPWMVALTKRNRFFCGGTLINDRYVTTAAHYIYRKEGDR
ncbi:hypothetical protein RUM44_010315 [Polyplax serrata]|uniref:Peptidase S1 domain-containing protein n=1 Tax=Polyplax serrata TaxID=468196 RepID=A0ABR1AV81_POLSC